MDFLQGIAYNLKGLRLGLKTPRLLMLGMIRFVVLLIVTTTLVVVAWQYYDDLTSLLWSKPDSRWLIWLWYLVSWLIALLLMVAGAVVGYLLAQILFCVLVVDLMSRITEKIATGQVVSPDSGNWWQNFFYLLRQEIPRALAPLMIGLMLTAVGWVTPLGPVITFLTVTLTAVFLAWDHTDLVPARRMLPFQNRYRFLRRHLSFHLGFGLLFFIPFANILFLSFAPVGATLYYLEGLEPAQNSKLEPAGRRPY